MENVNCVRHRNYSTQCISAKPNFMKNSVNKFIKEIQGSNGLKAEDSAASASILGSVSASPDKALFYSGKRENLVFPNLSEAT